MWLNRFAWAVALVLSSASVRVGGDQAASGDPSAPAYRVARSDDFTVDGTGSAPVWSKAEWQALTPRGAPGPAHPTRFKMLYSSTGLYVLMDGEDRTLTATMKEDFLDLWNEDVFEFFLWPDQRHPVYFEYEVSPLGYELPILVPNVGGQFYGWRPWHYEGARKAQKAIAVRGGPAMTGASITGWTAEVFVPYGLLAPLQNVPPQSGTRWRANVYRMDYDGGRTASWNWAPVRGTFHQPDKFGTLVFE
jgi:Carbohydrate family 9 binding domain-like